MLTEIEVIGVVKQAVFTVLIASLPMLGAALLIGVIISIFQATTQINEQTLSYVPKIIGVLLALVLFGGMILSKLMDFTTSLYAGINLMLR